MLLITNMSKHLFHIVFLFCVLISQVSSATIIEDFPVSPQYGTRSNGGKLTIKNRNSSTQRVYDYSDSEVRDALTNYVNRLNYDSRKYLIDFLKALGQGRDITIEVGYYGDSYYATYTRLPNGFSCLSAEENQKLFQKEKGTLGRLFAALTNSTEYQVIAAVYELGQFYYTPVPKIDEREQRVRSGDYKYNQKDYWGAIEEYSKAIDSGLKNYEVYYKRASSYYAIEFYNNAIDDYTHALSFKNTEEAHLYRGLCKLQVGDGTCIEDLMAGGTRGKSIAREIGATGVPSSGQTNNPNAKYRASGTGFFIDPRGYICTNEHVISGMNGIDVFITRNGKTEAFSASCILHDKTNDIAILKINDSRFKTMPSIPYSLGAGTKDVGSKVFAMGYPELSSLGEEIKVTDGIISSRTGYQGDATTYQISAPIQHGNSGGPLFDNNGSVIGITNAGIESLQNVGYAIKIAFLKMLVEDSPERINLPSSNQISSLSLTEKIKRISPYVVIIKTYYSSSSTPASRTQVSTSPSESQRQSPQKQGNPSRPAAKNKTINGHEFVDLGLSVMWATCNIGASSPSDNGSYFAWGETRQKSEYNWENYMFRVSGNSHENVTFSKYNSTYGRGVVDNKTRLDFSDDAARINWGGTWRMPTKAELDELQTKCTWTWTTVGGKGGYLVTSKTNGNSIFLPAAGSGANIRVGYYWSSSISSLPGDASCLYISYSSFECDGGSRSYGYSIRPVSD